MRPSASLLALLPVLAALACGELPPALPPDGGELEDAGTRPDAGNVADAGAQPDAGSTPDAGEPPDAGTAPDAGVAGPVRYPDGLRHSPLTPSVAAGLRAIAARAQATDNVFAKVGDSITVSTKFMSCLANPSAPVLDGRTQLQATLDHFRAGQAGTTTPYDRVSLAAGVGWRTEQVLAGNPSPLQQELDALSPRAALLMLGTNDMGFNDLDTYGREMFTIVDAMLARGTVPVMSTVPPRGDSATADARVPRYNAVVRGIAQARQVPYVELHDALLPLPSRGLGSDGVHLTSAGNACDFSAAGLSSAQNVRNLLNLEALHRVRGALAGNAAPDGVPAPLQGSGTAADPFIIPSLPFVDARDTRTEGTNRLSSYPSCSAANEAGPELYYRLDLPGPTNLRAHVISLGDSDMDIHLLGVGQTGSDCVARNNKAITQAGVQGRSYLSVDTWVDGAGKPQPGEYLLVVLADP